MILQYFKNPCCQLLIIDKCLFKVGKARLLSGRHQCRLSGTGLAAKKHHLSLALNHAVVLFLNCGSFRSWMFLTRYAILIPLWGIIHAFLCVQALTEGILHGFSIISNDYICGGVVIAAVQLHICHVFLIISLRLQEHVSCLIKIITLSWHSVLSVATRWVMLQAIGSQLSVFMHVGWVINLWKVLGLNGWHVYTHTWIAGNDRSSSHRLSILAKLISIFAH